jgi:hypothetical protein
VQPLAAFYAGIFQYAYVCADLDRAITHFGEQLGLGGFDIRRGLTVQDVEVDGRPADGWTINVAVTNVEHANVELIEPVGGPVELYRDVISDRRPATFHHFGVEVTDLDAVLRDIHASGRRTKLLGCMPGFCRFAYLDLRDEIGHFVEYVELDDLGRAHFTAMRAQALSTQGMVAPLP